jgi:hypothetical protein
LSEFADASLLAAASWPDAVGAIGSVATPLVVAGVAIVANTRLKAAEKLAWRSQELTRSRLSQYELLAPLLNDLMCYFTFIGCWKELDPPDVVKLKRQLDRQFHVAVPLLSPGTQSRYNEFMSLCFLTFGLWGEDAKLNTGFGQRMAAHGPRWRKEWETLFAARPGSGVTKEEQEGVRSAYDAVLAAFVTDVQINAVRPLYTTAPVSWNAH